MPTTLSLPVRITFCLAIVFSIVVGVRLTSRGQAQPLPPGTVVLDSNLVTESSGLARSRINDEVLWTHNDSGDWPRLFAITPEGSLAAILNIEGASANDWEDMCSFTRDGASYLAVADVGDNGSSRREVVIYGVKEPGLPPRNPRVPAKFSTELAFEVHVRYPDGPVNCEAIAYDPWREQFILASKENLRSRLFAIAFDPEKRQQNATAELIGSVVLPMVTGADISDDGQLLALSTYGPTCLLRRSPDVDWAKASSAERRQAKWYPKSAEELELIPAPARRQGEAICFDKSGKHLLMTSEGTPMPLSIVDLDVAPAAH
ncbi:MAG: hypothetical protein ACTHK7_09965 [Aureliella sp.]